MSASDGKETQVHPTAVVHPRARLGQGVRIGPYAVVEENVVLGDRCRVEPHAVLAGWTTIGCDNRIGVGAVIGLEPQDLHYQGEESYVRIGDRNNIREYAQIHRGTEKGTVTELGNDNFLLGFSHVAHNCKVGNGVILANGALLAGHVVVEDFAFISGHCLVHQFCRIGKYAMMRGGARVSLDIPPYTVSDDANAIRGINTVGLDRRGFSGAQIREIKKAYRQAFNGEKPLKEQVEAMLAAGPSAEVRYFLEFVKNAERGVCRPAADGGN